MDIEQIARATHEMNKRWCELHGDTSQVSWEDAPDWQRESAKSGVEFVLNDPMAGPEAQHDSWSEVKRADGWVWGPVKDPKTRQHPCLVPYDELPAVQRAKDSIFRAVVFGLTGV